MQGCKLKQKIQDKEELGPQVVVLSLSNFLYFGKLLDLCAFLASALSLPLCLSSPLCILVVHLRT